MARANVNSSQDAGQKLVSRYLQNVQKPYRNLKYIHGLDARPVKASLSLGDVCSISEKKDCSAALDRRSSLVHVQDTPVYYRQVGRSSYEHRQ